jgi:hypothetical protein
MVAYSCKKCGDINYLNSEALGNLTDFGFKCRYCNTINRIILEEGNLKNENSQIFTVNFFIPCSLLSNNGSRSKNN